jgi:hypothetical protein
VDFGLRCGSERVSACGDDAIGQGLKASSGMMGTNWHESWVYRSEEIHGSVKSKERFTYNQKPSSLVLGVECQPVPQDLEAEIYCQNE